MSKQKPAHEIRLSNVRATIWANGTGEKGPWHNVVFSRLYKAKDGSWKDSDSFARDELPLVAKLADLAFAWCREQQASPAEETEA